MFISGKINDDVKWGEGYCLALGPQSLAAALEDYDRQQVFIAYAFSAEPISPACFRDLAILSAEGILEADIYGSYSEITGWLWLNEKGKVGGHDLMEVFESHKGEYGALMLDTKPLSLTDDLTIESWYIP